MKVWGEGVTASASPGRAGSAKGAWQWPSPPPPAHPDPYVKVYLLQDGRKMSKKKTAVKRDDPNPVFNEAMIFSVPAIVLQVRRARRRGGARPGRPRALGRFVPCSLASRGSCRC